MRKTRPRVACSGASRLRSPTPVFARNLSRGPGRMLGVVFVVAFGAGALHGGPAMVYKEVNLVGGWSDQEGWVGESHSLRNSVGLEYFKRLAHDYGDFLTIDIQARVTYATSGAHGERWGLEVHNLWADYKLGLGSTVRFGHFEPAYGAAPSVDTHGTLLQTLAMHDVGFSHDWGVGYRTAVGPWDLETALGLGTGMGLHRRDRSVLFSFRVRKPAGARREYGVSVLYGSVLSGADHRTLPPPDLSDTTTARKRIAAHGLYAWGPFAFMAEATVGRDERDGVAGALGQIDVTVPSLQALTFQGQAWTWGAGLSHERARTSSFSLGATWRLSPSLAVRAAAFRDRPHHGEPDTRIVGQVYYYGR